ELEDRRSLGGGELDRYLADADRGVRRRAALAAGRIGSAELVPSLIERMNDAEPEVRQMAAFALGLIGDTRASERLLAALQDPEAVVRARAAEALGRAGGAGAGAALARFLVGALPPAQGTITVRGDDPGSASDPWLVMRLGLFALARLKDGTAAATVLLDGGRPRFDWWAATWTAMRLEHPALRPVLDAGARSQDALSRAQAARGLGALKDPSAVDLLSELARDRDPHVVVYALRSLAAIGDARGVAAVAAHLRSPDAHLLAEALKALALLPPDRGLRAQVVALVGHEVPAVRAAALGALVRLDREDFALVLSGLDPDPVWSVRAGLATALGGAGDEVSVGLLSSQIKDDDPRVAAAAVAALGKARGAQALETLRRHLEHPDYGVRAAAAEGLAALKVRGEARALRAAWERGLPDPDLEARLAVVTALAEHKDAAGAEALREIATRDPARAVRLQAAAALRAMGQEAPAAGVEAVERAPLDYHLAMAPYDPAPPAPLFTPRLVLHLRGGKVEIHLNVVEAPLASAAYLDLARRGFFNGLTFHRVVPGFVVQGGDPRGDGTGGPGFTLRDEVGQRPYGRGTVGIALAGKDTGGSQLFIALSPQPHLDGGYTVFGWVTRGMEVVDKIRPGDAIERVEVWTGR
ncbi:MAG TPA: HEAT repeat domain-containing protein, partial [Vicinamibacteria bacterium]|nr:HEAT repeat domain-containing protein [Vicinamibacteria bacterium]